MSEANSTVQLKFIFANYEGSKVLMKVQKSLTGSELKIKLAEQWPPEIPICDDLTRIRMICMGSGFITDNQVLGPKFPVFSHPTPINVSIKPATRKYAQEPSEKLSFSEDLNVVPRETNADRRDIERPRNRRSEGVCYLCTVS